MLIVYIIGFCYKDSINPNTSKQLFLPGIIIDLYQIYNIFSTIKPDKLIVITDIEDNVTMEIVLEAVREYKIDAHILTFITKLKNQDNYLQFVSKKQLLDNFKTNLPLYDKVFIYYTGHVENGSLLLPLYTKSPIIKRKIMNDSTIQSSLVNIPLPSDVNEDKDDIKSISNDRHIEDESSTINNDNIIPKDSSLNSNDNNNIITPEDTNITGDKPSVYSGLQTSTPLFFNIRKHYINNNDVDNIKIVPNTYPKINKLVVEDKSHNNSLSNNSLSNNDNIFSNVIFKGPNFNSHREGNNVIHIDNSSFSDVLTSKEFLDTIVNFTTSHAEIMIIMDCCMSDGLNLPYVLKDNVYKRNPNGNIKYGYQVNKKILLITSTLPNQNSIATSKGSIFTGILCRNILHGKKSLINLIYAVQSETASTYKQTPTIYVNNPLIKTLLHYLFPGGVFRVVYDIYTNSVVLKYLQ